MANTVSAIRAVKKIKNIKFFSCIYRFKKITHTTFFKVSSTDKPNKS